MRQTPSFPHPARRLRLLSLAAALALAPLLAPLPAGAAGPFAPAVFVNDRSIRATISVLVVLLLHGAVVVQLPPPPVRAAVFVTVCPESATLAVTGMTICHVLEPATFESAVLRVQVTTCPAAEHPAGSVPMVKLVGIVSVTVSVPAVGAVPTAVELVTVRV